jgi:hypothetical protein
MVYGRFGSASSMESRDALGDGGKDSVQEDVR